VDSEGTVATERTAGSDVSAEGAGACAEASLENKIPNIKILNMFRDASLSDRSH
jgi:hypothetical protein